MRILIIGGTGVISRAITRELLKRGMEVVLLNRGSKPVEFGRDVRSFVADRHDLEAVHRALGQERFDCVIDMICFNRRDAEQTVALFRERAGHILFTSSSAAYAKPHRSLPTVETAERLWEDPVFPYAFHKAEMERYLRELVAKDKLAVTIIRPHLTYGAGAANIGVLRQNYGIVDRMRRGKPLVMFGDGSAPISWTFVEDLAVAYAGLAGNPLAFGQDYHATSEEAHIWKDLYMEIGRLIGVEPYLIYVPASILNRAAPNLCAHLYYEKTYAGLYDNSKIRSAVPDFKPAIGLSKGLAGILEWWEREARAVDPAKDKLEDQLAALHDEFGARCEGLFTP